MGSMPILRETRIHFFKAKLLCFELEFTINSLDLASRTQLRYLSAGGRNNQSVIFESHGGLTLPMYF